MTPNHLFRIASHSKTFTATAVMQLQEAGKINIYEPISEYLTFLKDNPDKRVHDITIQQILSHSAGIWRDGEDPSFWRLNRPFPSKEEIKKFYQSQPLIIDSNTRFKYSNYGYALLGYLIEEITGKTYVDYMSENILEPIGLNKEIIGADYDQTVGLYITGYTGYTPPPKQECVPISAAIATNQLASATGFYANAESLCRFYTAIMLGSGELLSDKSKREMLRMHWQGASDPNQTGYSLGFRYLKMGNRILRGHAGGMPGNGTRTYFDQDDSLVVSVLSNSHEGKPNLFIKGVLHIIDFYKENYKKPSPFKKFQCSLYDVWGVESFVPIGDKIYSSYLSSPELFADCSELEHKEGNVFKITKDDGYSSYGQDVEFFMDGDKVTSASCAGFPMQDKEGYLEYAEKLKRKND